MKTTTNLNPSVYVGTYGKYNNGSLFGKWVNLTDFTSKDEFIEYCNELHKDEHEPELMFQDWEYFPENTISECSINDEIFEFLQLDEYEQKQVLIYNSATGYNLKECMEQYENMSCFNAENIEDLFFEFYPDLEKIYNNNSYIKIDFQAFEDEFIKVELDGETYLVSLD